MREPIRDNFCRMAKPISMAASVSFAISLANCFRSDTFEGARAGLGDVDVLILGAIAYADCPDTNVIHLQRQAAARRPGDARRHRPQQCPSELAVPRRAPELRPAPFARHPASI